MSARRGHSFSNGHVVKVAKETGAGMVLDSDAHGPDDLLTPELTRKIAMGAGLTEKEAHALIELNPQKLLARIGFDAILQTPAKGATS